MFRSRKTREALTVISLLLSCSTGWAEEEPPWAATMDQLVRQLNDNDQSLRDAAEEQLLKLAPIDNMEQTDKFLEDLPLPAEGMPAEVKLRLERLRQRIETEQTERVLAATRISLSLDGQSLEEILSQIQKQTGNKLVDFRERFGQPTTPLTTKLKIEDEPFWSAVDNLLDETGLTLYPFSGEDALGVIRREENASPRAEDASYSGPFRIEAVRVTSVRNLKTIETSRGNLQLEITWEPRLRPIAISQAAQDVKITANDGSPVLLEDERRNFAVEIQSGSHACELTIPFVLPPRNVSEIASFQGQLSTLLPGRVVEFQFKDLQQKDQEQAKAGVKVTLQQVRKNQQLWEIHMKLRVESKEAGLESHRGWVFQNLTYLLNKQGELIDHVGFETTMQSEREIGFAYLFDLPNDKIEDYTWVYRTPAAILKAPIKFELKDIPLP